MPSSLCNASALLSRPLGSQNKIKDSEIADAYEDMVDARNDAFDDMKELVDAARSLGYEDSKVYDVLRSANISKDNVRAVMNGSYQSWRVTSQFLRSAEKRALATAKSIQRRRELEGEFAKRRVIVKKLSRETRETSQQTRAAG